MVNKGYCTPTITIFQLHQYKQQSHPGFQDSKKKQGKAQGNTKGLP